MIKKYLVFWLKALFFIGGTFLHEMSHYIAAKITGAKVVGFSLIPRIIRDKTNNRITGYEYGSVEFYPKIKALNFIVGFAPISLWILLWYILTYTGVVIPNENTFAIDFELLLEPSSFWIWFICIQLVTSGFPSSVDLKMSFTGLFSLSGIILISLVISVFIYQIHGGACFKLL